MVLERLDVMDVQRIATSPDTLRTPRSLLASLLSSIPAPGPDASANPLRDAPAAARNLFLTLYTLFEREWLPAIDLLDRRLVTRLKLASESTPPPPSGGTAAAASVFVVRSAQQQQQQQQQQASRTAAHEHVSHYEVRLAAWSCSCPAFVFSAFPAGSSTADVDTRLQAASDVGLVDTARPVIGGLTRGDDLPVCKHLLACLLGEYCDMFAPFVDEAVVSVEEMGGWAAGWGD